MSSRTVRLSWLALAVAGLSIAAGVFIGSYFQRVDSVPIVGLAVDEACQITEKACVATGDGLDVSVMLRGAVTPMTTFDVAVHVEGVAVEKLHSVGVEFVMRGMDMGRNRYVLQRGSFRGAGSDWETQAMLPVCTVGRSDWIAIVTVLSAQRKYVAEFAFVAAAVR